MTPSPYLFTRGQGRPEPGEFFRITRENFPVLRGLAIQDLDMEPGAVRRPHLHPNAAQMDFCVAGRGQVGIVEPSGQRHMLDLAEGDAAFIPQGWLHWITNTGKDRARFILMVTHEDPETVEFQGMLRAVPTEYLAG